MMQKTEIQDLKDLQKHYSTMLDMCTTTIKKLMGLIPDGSKFTFSIQEAPVVTFDITEDNGDFCMTFFVSWRQYYLQKLDFVTKRLDWFARNPALQQ